MAPPTDTDGVVCGIDTHQLFQYETPTITVIKHRPLGLTRMMLLFGIFLYIVVYSMLYQGSHFKINDVSGMNRLQWQEPVMQCNPMDIDCSANFTDLKDLPYCESYTGKHPATEQFRCGYFEAWELPITMPGAVLLPTKFAKYNQVEVCDIHVESCSRKYKFVDDDGNEQTGEGKAEPVYGSFVANVEDFTLMIDHNFRTTSGSQAHDDDVMQGYFETCDVSGDNCTKLKIKCVKGRCKDFPSDGEPEPDFPDAPFSIDDGDVFSVRRLLSMAGITMEDLVGEGTRRSRGFAIVVDITYDNSLPFSFYSVKDPPEYTFSVSTRDFDEFKHSFVYSKKGKERSLMKAYGMDIRLIQGGEIREFDVVTCLVMLTATLTLLALADTATNFLALNCMPNKEEYREAMKYEHKVGEDNNVSKESTDH